MSTGTGSTVRYVPPVDFEPDVTFIAEPDGPPRTSHRPVLTIRSVARAAAVVVVALAGLLAIGYFLLMRHVDPRAAHTQVAQELRELALESGETVERSVWVHQRHWWDFFRATHGVIAATDRRLLFIGVSPMERVTGERGPVGFEQAVFSMDTSTGFSAARANFGLAFGISVRDARGSAEQFAVARDDIARAREIIAHVAARHAVVRTAAAREREARLAADSAVRSPIYYTVKRGDALESVAAAYNTSADLIREWNTLSDDRIRAGQVLMVKPQT